MHMHKCGVFFQIQIFWITFHYYDWCLWKLQASNIEYYLSALFIDLLLYGFSFPRSCFLLPSHPTIAQLIVNSSSHVNSQLKHPLSPPPWSSLILLSPKYISQLQSLWWILFLLKIFNCKIFQTFKTFTLVHAELPHCFFCFYKLTF